MFVGLSVSCMWGCPFGILLVSSVIVRTTKTGAPHIPQPFRNTLHTTPTRTCLGFTNSPHIPQPSRGTLYTRTCCVLFHSGELVRSEFVRLEAVAAL